MAKKHLRTVWWVEHPVHGLAIVQAPDWELATVEAAKWWDVPWGKVAAACVLQKKMEVPKFVCAECGNHYYGTDGNRIRCPMCQAKARDKEINSKAAGRRYWKQMGPRRTGN